MTIARQFLAALLLAFASLAVQAEARRTFSQPELDRMLAPVALYPDPLLSQVLMAATYPADVVEAARWSRANPQLSGDDAVRAAAGQDWDPSVVSLLAFPQLLQRMDENLAWTRSLGEAFLGQEPHVMETVQQLRRRAHASGNLRSDDRILVQPEGQVIVLAPAQPQLVYLPYYDPLVVYGPWWWPAYQPVYWAPWPGYVGAHRPGVTVSFWWGAPVRLSLGFFFGGVDWHHRHVRVVHVHNHYVHAGRHRHIEPGHWRHEDRRIGDRARDEPRRAALPPARPIEQPRARAEVRTFAQPERPRARPEPQAHPERQPRRDAPAAREPARELPRAEPPRREFPRPAPVAERPRERPTPQVHMPAPRPEPRGEARNSPREGRPQRGGERS